MKLIAFGDTREEAWNVFSETGELKDALADLPIMPLDLAIALEPDLVVIASTDPHISHSLRYMIIKKGWFPQTALELEDEIFALAYLDALLYRPTLAGLEFFFPRMSQGGVMVLRGLEDDAYRGAARAVADFEAKYGALLLMPLGDLRGAALIVHP